MKEIKIGIDIRNIGKNRTGDEVVFFNLCKSLKNNRLYKNINQAKKFKFLLFTDIVDEIKVREIEKKLDIVENKDFKIISLDSKNKFIWNFWTLPNYLRKNPVDVYHTQYITPFFVSRKVKIITVIHDISFNFYTKYIKKLDLFFLKILIPLSIKRADRVVTVSGFSKKEIIKFYNVDSEKVQVVTNSVSDDFKKDFSQEELEEVRKKYKLPGKFILYVGTLQPRKNVVNLIKAFALIKNKLPETKLVLVGNKEAHNFDASISENISSKGLSDDVIFPGYVDQNDLPKIYKLAHVFVFPSFYEGFGIPILEAMSQGVPVTASSIESLQEVGDEAILYFDPSSVEEISEKLYTISVESQKRENLKKKSIVQLNKFSWDKSAQKILEIYDDLS